MDNGLIFPYWRNNVRAERGDAKHARSVDVFGLNQAESVTQTSSRQAAEGRRKVAHPGRWLSRAKCVGRDVGKSASHSSLRHDGSGTSVLD